MKPAYAKVAWLFVNRNFDDSPNDLLAQRIELRFGISSYPHLLLVDPETLGIFQEIGRSEPAFLDAVRKTSVKVSDAKAAAEKFRHAEERLAGLDKRPNAANAKKHLGDDDIVVRYRALQLLAKLEPKMIVGKAGELLETPHDRFRYEVCGVLAKSGDKSAAPALEEMIRSPKDSLNPNVLRIRAVDALARCGREESVEVLTKFAAAADYNNGLTGVTIDTLAAIAGRTKKARPAVKDALVLAYPSPLKSGAPADRERCLALAQKVHMSLAKVTGKNVAFPAVYDEAARAKLVKSW